MKLSEFVEYFKKQDAEKISTVNIRKYIPIDEKFEILSNAEKKLIELELSDGVLVFVRRRELLRFFNIMLAYTDLEVDDDSKSMYDACLTIDIDKFFNHYIGRDYKRFCDMFDEALTISDAYALRESLMSVGKQNLDEEFANIMKEIGDNADILGNLNEIMRINYRGLHKETV